MHYAVLAILPEASGSIKERLSALLAPHENEQWDWWQVGGRFSGYLDGYDPEKDPANIEVCDQCNGTGIRPGGLEQFGKDWFDGYNGCNGVGKAVKWPTEWVEHSGDVAPVESLTEEQFGKFYVVVSSEGWYPRVEYVHSEPIGKFEDRVMPSLDRVKGQGVLAVVLDCQVLDYFGNLRVPERRKA